MSFIQSIDIALTVAAIQAGYTALNCSTFDFAENMAEAEATCTLKKLIDNLFKVAGAGRPGNE